MSRARLRLLKKVLRQGDSMLASSAQIREAQEAALQLLRRSVALKHDRLAILRLADAVRVGASVEDSLWEYCRSVTSSQSDPDQWWTLRILRHHTQHHFQSP